MMNTSYNFEKAHQAGAWTNSLGILSKDKKNIDSEMLLKVTGLGRTNLAEVGKVSRQQLYKKEIPLNKSNKFIKRVIDVVMVTDLAYELFGNNNDETSAWLMAPNSLLFGDTPFEVCMRGDGEPLYRWLLERLGKTPIAN